MNLKEALRLIKNSDESFLRRYRILNPDRYPEKLTEFRVKKNKELETYTNFIEDAFKKEFLLEDEILGAQEGFIACLVDALCQYIALSELLYEEAVKNGPSTFPLEPIQASPNHKRPHLRLVKT